MNVIELYNLGKRYTITHESMGVHKYTALRDVLTDSVKNLWRRTTGKGNETVPAREEIWALKEINLEVEQGEKLGIIGRNGAGKTTLLKILSRITEPTEGYARIKGRVSSLLEVGTGFHNELTGRENIYLNGAILGMKKTEIDKKFDEIVDFSGVEKFLDTPVKRYSSGMNVRLAFAVAAHLEPEILLVDEVLAVGDAEFQKKCLGKMDEVSKQHGRTILFVSHNLSTVENLCNKGILLRNGRIESFGNTHTVINKYLENIRSRNTCGISLLEREDRTGTHEIKASSLEILDNRMNIVENLKAGEDYIFRLGYVKNNTKKLRNVIVSLDIYDEMDTRLLMFRSDFTNNFLDIETNTGFINCRIRNFPLTNGEYNLSVFIGNNQSETFDWLPNAKKFSVLGGDFFGTGSIGMPTHCRVLHKADWFLGES